MNSTESRVLIVDDEPQILRALRAALRGNGYDVKTAIDGEDALDAIASHPPDVVVLDLVMPGKDGFEVVREVRTWSHVPIIVLSARGGERDKVIALDLGADDYLTKPFSMNELLARIRVALRHQMGEAIDDPMVRAGEVTIDFARRVVTRHGAIVHLSPTEWMLIAELARHRGKVLTHRMLLERVWGPQHVGEPQYLRVYMNQLRRKIEAETARPQILITEPGIGYRLVTDDVFPPAV